MDSQNQLYQEAIAAYGSAVNRLSRGYESDPDRRRDLLQEIHIGLWRSFASFDGRCSLRTWMYRVSHNVAASHIVRNRRTSQRLVSLDDAESELRAADGEEQAGRRHSAEKLLALVHQLKPLDRQILMLHLEGEQASAIAETTGLSPVNVATKLHRIRKLLTRQFQTGEQHAGK